MASRVKYGYSYEWSHEEYCGCTTRMKYIEESDGSICIMKHHYTAEWYNDFTKNTEHMISIASGTIDHVQREMCLHPEYTIQLHDTKPTLSQSRQLYTDFHARYIDYAVIIDTDMKVKPSIINACLKNANLNKKHMKTIKTLLYSN